ncbi:MAG: primosomal protein N' [Candidatus Improbicoccus pseudotrichonymphae]|uniref:Replication restart protein PriA n=1 Tax=Candidatus Improbicoccus pseudotrichonymphae TaxID=3033792 RepID=A0AA48I3D8_9FIRM|nr:MAG: primosomal protein N' [Candidatus Improbicoccus pseudotrichonymphae]
MKKIKIAKVAVKGTKFNFDCLYSYIVPEHFSDTICEGYRVKIPFGRNNSIRFGLVFSIDFEENTGNFKEIRELVDVNQILDLNLLDMATWLAKKYFCTSYEVFDFIVPNVIKRMKADLIPSRINKLEKVEFIKQIFLNKYQELVFLDLIDWYKNQDKPSLFFGITGSGKTFVLLKICEFVLRNNKNIIFMVPEISLIEQTVNIFKEYFGGNEDVICVLHSGMSGSKRKKEWCNIKSGKARIVIGTRSAVFAPLDNLGIIIMDEEHEIVYKSETTPRYHAREVAYFRCKNENAKLLLVSATPSLESFYFAKTGKYFLCSLDKRFGKAVLPKIKIINMEKNKFKDVLLSEELCEKIKKKFQKGEQTILLLNRRGFHTFVKCVACNEVLFCKNCNISLNYHKKIDKLKCHYCSTIYPKPKSCPKCEKDKLCFFGSGTQKIEYEINNLMPELKISRVDSDNINKDNNYKKIFEEFRKKKYDLMIGTRMIAKGLNFENVTLVGVLSADQSLYDWDFRSYEHTFSLISQVSGRCGRGEKPGEVIIQTFMENHPVINFASKQKYEFFYENEIKIRKSLLYPPFSDICLIGFYGENKEKANFACKFFYNILKEEIKSSEKIPVRILSPSPAVLEKAFNKFRFKIIIKCKNSKKFRNILKKTLIKYEINEIVKRLKGSVFMFVDMNPMVVF